MEQEHNGYDIRVPSTTCILEISYHRGEFIWSRHVGTTIGLHGG